MKDISSRDLKDENYKLKIRNLVQSSNIVNIIASKLNSSTIKTQNRTIKYADLIYMNSGVNPRPKLKYNILDESSATNENSEDEDDDEESNLNTETEYAYVIVPIKVKKIKSPEQISNKENSSKKKLKNNNINEYKESLRYKKVCYVTNWSQYRASYGRFLPENVDPFLCTHVVYAFAYIDKVTLTITTVEENDEEMYKRINNLKSINPKLKTLLAIGGWKLVKFSLNLMI